MKPRCITSELFPPLFLPVSVCFLNMLEDHTIPHNTVSSAFYHFSTVRNFSYSVLQLLLCSQSTHSDSWWKLENCIWCTWWKAIQKGSNITITVYLGNRSTKNYLLSNYFHTHFSYLNILTYLTFWHIFSLCLLVLLSKHLTITVTGPEDMQALIKTSWQMLEKENIILW